MTPVLAALLASALSHAPPTVDLELSGVLGLKDAASFGGLAQVTLGVELWHTPAVAGSPTVGVLVGYQTEPYSSHASFFPGTTVGGATGRFELLLVAGHEFRFFPSRRLLVGVHLFAGWLHASAQGSLSNASVAVAGTYAASTNVLSSGALLRLGVRLTERFSVVGSVIGPFPYAAAVTPYVIFTVGGAVRL
jgi:hypothetical protein